jgi:hypothetical protein
VRYLTVAPFYLMGLTFCREVAPVVYDVFTVAIKEHEAFQQPQKCGGEKPHKGRSPSRYCGEAYTILLCAVFAFLHIFEFSFLSYNL